MCMYMSHDIHCRIITSTYCGMYLCVVKFVYMCHYSNIHKFEYYTLAQSGTCMTTWLANQVAMQVKNIKLINSSSFLKHVKEVSITIKKITFQK